MLGRSIAFAATLAAGVAMAGAAHAVTGYTLVLGGNTDNNIPDFVLTNDSDTALITDFNVTIGNTAFNFDNLTIISSPAGGSSTVNTGSTANGGSSPIGRTDVFDVSFSSFDPGDSATFTNDIDPDDSNTVVDFRDVFFNNGVAPNSVITVSFSDTTVLSLTMPDAGDLASYTFTQSDAIGAVPVPAALPLMAAGVGVFGLMGWRRKRTA